MHKETRSTCPYCGVGCGVIIESRREQIIGVRGDPDHPANFGRLCSKGSTLHLTATPGDAADAPAATPAASAARCRARSHGWDAALDLAATRFADTIRTHGPDAVGFYVSGQLLTEDYYVFNKLAKGLIGTNNIDTNSRLCMSSAVAGYKLTLGADAPPACYEDVDHADCLFITGSNAAWAHPVLFRRIEDAKRRTTRHEDRRGGPAPHRHRRARPTSLCRSSPAPTWRCTTACCTSCCGRAGPMRATSPTTPRASTLSKPWCATTRPTAWPRPAALPRKRCMRRRASSPRAPVATHSSRGATLSLYCQGLNQSSSGTAKNATLINLHLATGQIGRPGAGPFSLTGQPNAMGGREVGGLANLLSAHRDLANPQHRAEVAALWGVPSVPERPGKTAVEMFQAAADGEIKVLWIACTNPAQSMPDQATVRRALQRAEFVVVQEAFLTTSTCDYADLLLPATTWGEKDGTVTNSERRITRVRPAVAAPARRATTGASAGGLRAPAANPWASARVRAICSPTRPPSPSGTNTASPRAAAIWTSPA
jgi:assimilatory nitrate reductase catalytic subunit